MAQQLDCDLELERYKAMAHVEGFEAFLCEEIEGAVAELIAHKESMGDLVSKMSELGAVLDNRDNEKYVVIKDKLIFDLVKKEIDKRGKGSAR